MRVVLDCTFYIFIYLFITSNGMIPDIEFLVDVTVRWDKLSKLSQVNVGALPRSTTI